MKRKFGLKFVVVLTLYIIIFTSTCMAFDSNNKLVVNDQIVDRKVYVSDDGYVMLPLRLIAQILGYEVTWNSISNSAKISKGSQWFKVSVNMDEYNIERNKVKLGKAAELVDSVIYVPAEFFSKMLGVEVVFNGGKVTVRSKDNYSNLPKPKHCFMQNNEIKQCGSVKLEMNWEIPMITGLDDLEFENYINEILKNEVLSGMYAFKRTAEKDGIELSKNGFNLNYQYMIGDTWLDVSNHRYMSIVMNGYVYTGGAHGQSFRVAKTFDVIEKCEVKLSDLFLESSGYEMQLKSIMNSRILADKILVQYIIDDIYIDDRKEYDFYFENGDLVIYYSPYEIAAYAAGFIDFPLSLITLSPYFKYTEF